MYMDAGRAKHVCGFGCDISVAGVKDHHRTLAKYQPMSIWLYFDSGGLIDPHTNEAWVLENRTDKSIFALPAYKVHVNYCVRKESHTGTDHSETAGNRFIF